MLNPLKNLVKLIVSVFIFTACQNQTLKPKAVDELLTAHKWQLVAETELNLKSDLLLDNVVEFKRNGNWVYYDDSNSQKIFTQNRWTLSQDRKKLIETIADGSKIENEIVEINENQLKIRFQEVKGSGDKAWVTETYARLKN